MQVQRKTEIAKQAIMKACKTCSGNGCRDCASRVERVTHYARASIPVKYWNLSLDTFQGDANFKEFITNQLKPEVIHNMYAECKSYAFAGRFGVGKTFGACEILKGVQTVGYTAKYTTMNEIVDMVTSKEERYEFKQTLLLSDFLVIDEFDGRYIPTSEVGKEVFGTNLEGIVRARFQNMLPIIICTNNSSVEDVFDGTFKQTLGSLFSENITHIPVGGVDLR